MNTELSNHKKVNPEYVQLQQTEITILNTSNQTSTDEDTVKDIDEVDQREYEILPKRQSGPPDGGWGWVVVIASVFASLIGDGISYTLGVFTPDFVNHFDASRGLIGCMGSVIIGTTLCSGPIVSFACDKWGYRKPTILGAIIASFAFAVPYFYANLWLMIVMTSIVAGFGFGLVYLPSILIVNVYFDKKRSLALGIAVCGSGIGTFILSPIIELLLDEYGWQGAMLVVSALILNIIPCGLLYRSLESNDSTDNLEGKDKMKIMKDEVSLKFSMYHVLSNPIFILFAISNFLTSLGFNAPYLYIKDRAVIVGISASNASLLISSIGIGNCIGRILFGYLATTKFINRFHIYNMSLMVGGLFLIFSWASYNYYWMICYSALFGMMAGTYVTMTSVVIVDTIGMLNLNAAFGFISVAQGVAEFAGPPLTGAIFDLTKSYDIAFIFCGGFIFLSGLMMYLAYISKDFRSRVKTFTG